MPCAGSDCVLLTAEELKCNACKSTFHHQCAGMSSTVFKKMTSSTRSKWKCKSCSVTSSPATSPHLTTDKLNSSDTDVFSCKFEEFKKELFLKIDSDMGKLKSDLKIIKDLTATVEFLTYKFDEINKSQISQTAIIEELKRDYTNLKQEMSLLNSRLNLSEQQSRENNIELQCIPESNNENIPKIINQLGNACKINIKDTDIKSCFRIAKKNTDSSRPRAIIVKLDSPRSRDNILAAVKLFNKNNPKGKLNASHIGFTGTSPIFAVEHLSPANKELHAETRKKAKENNFKFVWVRNGRIFVRKDITTPALLISNIHCLDKIN